MVISKKPLHFIAAVLVAFMPLISAANPVNDSTVVENHAVAKAEGVSHEEESITPEEERAEFIQHHLLDSHDFSTLR